MQTKRFWWEVKKQKLIKPLQTNKGNLVKDEKIEKWEKAGRSKLCDN